MPFVSPIISLWNGYFQVKKRVFQLKRKRCQKYFHVKEHKIICT